LRRIIDLSHPITQGMPVYPGDPDVQTTPIHTITKSGFNVTLVTLGTHAGTHIDVPHHVLFSDRAVDSIPMDALVGWADVLNLTGKELGRAITAADLDEFSDRLHEGARVLIRTDWSKRFGEPEFFTQYPGISEGAAEWLKGRKVKLIAVEQPSVDIDGSSKTHKALLTANMVIVESIANLHSLTRERVYLTVLPLNLVGLDGSPARAIAVEGMDLAE
jgi:arylformamidase